jgi:hypothetical protein
MCVAAPRSRTPIADPTSATGPCSGSLSIDFNSIVQSGIDPDLVAGVMIQGQWWYRDPADPQGFGTATSDAIEFAIGL